MCGQHFLEPHRRRQRQHLGVTPFPHAASRGRERLPGRRRQRSFPESAVMQPHARAHHPPTAGVADAGGPRGIHKAAGGQALLLNCPTERFVLGIAPGAQVDLGAPLCPHEAAAMLGKEGNMQLLRTMHAYAC